MSRLLGVVRLSKEHEESTSEARQQDHIRRYADTHGHEIVGWAIDLGVSASVDPWKRPALGPWLSDLEQPFDILCAWRVDRVARRVLHFARLLEWCADTGRTLVSATEGLDFVTPMGRVFAHIIAALAEGELEAIRERQQDSYRHLTATGRYRGGCVPLGYKPVPNPGGKGYRLEIDPEAAALIKDLQAQAVGGKSLNSLVADLNRRGVPTSLDRQRVRMGRESKDSHWRIGTLSRLLRSETLLGYVHAGDGKPVVDDSGMRVRRAEPILTPDEWAELQAELDARGGNRKPRPRVNSAMLRRVAFCACGRPLHSFKGGRAPGVLRYRCASKAINGLACGAKSVRAEDLEGWLSSILLKECGDLDVTQRVFVPGESHREEIKQTEAALGRLADRLHLVPDGPAVDAVVSRMGDHTTALERLRSLPERSDSYRYVATGETFRQLWSRIDHKERGDLLRDAGLRITISGPQDVGVQLLGSDALADVVRLRDDMKRAAEAAIRRSPVT